MREGAAGALLVCLVLLTILGRSRVLGQFALAAAFLGAMMLGASLLLLGVVA